MISAISDLRTESVRVARSQMSGRPAIGPTTFWKNSGSAQARAPWPRTGTPRETSFVSTTARAASTPKTADRPLSFTS